VGVDHAGESFDHWGRHGLPEHGQQRPFKPLLAVPCPMRTDSRTLRFGEPTPVHPIPIHRGAFLPRGRLGYHPCPATATAQEAREQIGGVRYVRASAGRVPWPNPVGPLYERQALLDGLPEVGANDSKLRMLLADPLLGRPGKCSTAPRFRILDEPPLIPDPHAGILLVSQDDSDCRDGPPPPMGAALSVLSGRGTSGRTPTWPGGATTSTIVSGAPPRARWTRPSGPLCSSA